MWLRVGTAVLLVLALATTVIGQQCQQELKDDAVESEFGGTSQFIIAKSVAIHLDQESFSNKLGSLCFDLSRAHTEFQTEETEPARAALEP